MKASQKVKNNKDHLIQLTAPQQRGNVTSHGYQKTLILAKHILPWQDQEGTFCQLSTEALLFLTKCAFILAFFLSYTRMTLESFQETLLNFSSAPTST